MNEQIPEWLMKEALGRFCSPHGNANPETYSYIAGILSRSGGVWVKASERLPEGIVRGQHKSSDWVLVSKAEGAINISLGMYDYHAKGWFDDYGSQPANDIKFWMPLPEPPGYNETLPPFESPAADKGDAIDGWISSKEKLPNININVLAVIDNGFGEFGIDIIRRTKENEWYRPFKQIHDEFVTHWRPLPQLPQSK